MNFDVSKEGGRTLYVLPEELVCGWCHKRALPQVRWYYFDFDRQLYCESCARSNFPVPLLGCNVGGADTKWQFWLVDSLRYGSGKLGGAL